MRIYVFKFNKVVKDWVFAPTMKEAKEFYMQHNGLDNLENYEVSIVPKKDYKNHYILDLNESEPYYDDEDYDEDDYMNGYKIIETFAEYAERETTTDLISTTEY